LKSPSGKTDVTTLLEQASTGDESAVRRLMPLVYDELRRLAEFYLRQERSDHTLQATALVHEAYLRLIKQDQVDWQNRAHFFGVAAQSIRRILVDHARHHQRLKRGGDRQRIALDDDVAIDDGRELDLVGLDDALTKLSSHNPRAAEIVELRFFGGLTREEVGEYLGVAVRTVADDWRYARAWLRRELSPGPL